MSPSATSEKRRAAAFGDRKEVVESHMQVVGERRQSARYVVGSAATASMRKAGRLGETRGSTIRRCRCPETRPRARLSVGRAVMRGRMSSTSWRKLGSRRLRGCGSYDL